LGIAVRATEGPPFKEYINGVTVAVLVLRIFFSFTIIINEIINGLPPDV
jgi:hypothetical protein